MNSSDIIKCNECRSVFTKKKNLNAHLRKYHAWTGPDEGQNKKPKLEYTMCSKLFSSKYTLKIHVNNQHLKENDHDYAKSSQNTSRLLCPQKNCDNKFSNYSGLRDHLNKEHSMEIEKETHEFISVEHFNQWKDRVQQATNSYYTLDTASKLLSNCIKKQYLNCHRSYYYKSKGKKIRSLKSIGTNKIGKVCPSRMEVEVYNENLSKNNEEGVKVTFYKTHCGHECEVGHTVLDKNSREEIAGKLKEGVSFDHVLHSIRDNTLNQPSISQRLSLIKRKDLHNIVRDYNIEYGTKRHSNDAVSVKLWVEEMQTSKIEKQHRFYSTKRKKAKTDDFEKPSLK